MKLLLHSQTSLEVWEWMCGFISNFTWRMITYPCWDLIQSMLIKGTLVVGVPYITLNQGISAKFVELRIICITLLQVTYWPFSLYKKYVRWNSSHNKWHRFINGTREHGIERITKSITWLNFNGGLIKSCSKNVCMSNYIPHINTRLSVKACQ